MSPTRLRLFGVAAVLCLGAQFAAAQEAVIRKTIAERLPDFPKIDEISKTPIPGLYELRIGTDILYSDAQGTDPATLRILVDGVDLTSRFAITPGSATATLGAVAEGAVLTWDDVATLDSPAAQARRDMERRFAI